MIFEDSKAQGANQENRARFCHFFLKFWAPIWTPGKDKFGTFLATIWSTDPRALSTCISIRFIALFKAKNCPKNNYELETKRSKKASKKSLLKYQRMEPQDPRNLRFYMESVTKITVSSNCQLSKPMSEKHKKSTRIASNGAPEAAFKTMKNPTLPFPDVLQEMSRKQAHFEALRPLLFRPVRHLFFESILAPLRRGCRKVFTPVLRALLYIDI